MELFSLKNFFFITAGLILGCVIIGYIVPTHFYTLDCAEILYAAKTTYLSPKLLFIEPLKYTGLYTSGGNQLRFLERLIPTLIYGLGSKNLFFFHAFLVVLYAGTAIIIYRLGKLLSNGIGGIISSFLFLTSSLAILCITDIGFIATWMESFFIIAALYYFFSALENNKWSYVIRGLLFSIFAYLSKETSQYILPIVLLAYLFITRLKHVLRNKIAGFIMFFSLFSLFLFIRSSLFIVHFSEIIKRFSVVMTSLAYPNFTGYWSIMFDNYKITLLAFFLFSAFIVKKKNIICLVWLLVAFLPALFWIHLTDRFIYNAAIALFIFIGISISLCITWIKNVIRNAPSGLIVTRIKRAIIFIFAFLVILELGKAVFLNLKRIEKTILRAKAELRQTCVIMDRIINLPRNAKIINGSGLLAKAYYGLMLGFLDRHDISIADLNDENFNFLIREGIMESNMIKNPSFERGLESWDFGANISGISTPVLPEYSHGKVLKVDFGGIPNFCHIIQRLPVKRNTYYFFGARMKLEDFLAFGCIEVQDSRGHKRGCWRTLILHNNVDWIWNTSVFNSGSAQEIKIFPIRIPEFVKGSMLVDDVFLCRVYPQDRIKDVYFEYEYNSGHN